MHSIAKSGNNFQQLDNSHDFQAERAKILENFLDVTRQLLANLKWTLFCMIFFREIEISSVSTRTIFLKEKQQYQCVVVVLYDVAPILCKLMEILSDPETLEKL